MTGKRILITGGGGFLGSHLVRRLHGKGHEVFLLASPAFSGRRLGDLAGCLPILHTAITDIAGVAAVVGKARPDIIFHLASTPFNPPTTSASEHLNVIAGGTLALLEAMRAAPRARLVATGSAAEYGDGNHLREHDPLRPTTWLGAAKAAATLLVETWVRMYGIDAVIVRLFTPFGPWEAPRRLIPYTIGCALKNRPVQLTSGSQQRDFLYVDDVADAMERAAFQPLDPGAVINVCSGRATTAREAAALVLEHMGNPVPLETGAQPGRSDDIKVCSGDPGRAQELLGWRPTVSLPEGIARTVDWFRDNRQWLLSCP